MKVERIKTKPVFAPIVITLETEAEATHLWHKLNTTKDFSEYCRTTGISENYVLDCGMWRALDKVLKEDW